LYDKDCLHGVIGHPMSGKCFDFRKHELGHNGKQFWDESHLINHIPSEYENQSARVITDNILDSKNKPVVDFESVLTSLLPRGDERTLRKAILYMRQNRVRLNAGLSPFSFIPFYTDKKFSSPEQAYPPLGRVLPHYHKGLTPRVMLQLWLKTAARASVEDMAPDK
jgi:hypothetical protein